MGLTDYPHGPYIYKGKLTPGVSPIFIGLYNDFFVCFSKFNEVKEQFRVYL